MVRSFVAYGRQDGVPSSIRPSVGFIQFALAAFKRTVYINALYNESVQ